MTRAEEAALKAYPKFLEYYPHVPSSTCGPDGFTPKVTDHNAFGRQLFQEGYKQSQQDIIALIQSRIDEILGDAQPAPILRMELQELIKKIEA